MRGTSINEAEVVVERFWDPLRSRLPEWQFSCDAGAGGAVKQQWPAVYLTWTHGKGVVARLRRQLDLETDGCDHLTLCLSLAATCRLTVRATVDSQPQTVIDGQPGQNTFAEYDGPLHGARIESLEIEISDESQGAGVSTLHWLGLFNKGRRDAMRGRVSPFTDGWGDLILPASESVKAQPTLGIFFDTADLAALRRKADSPPYDLLMQGLRKIAQSHLDDEPWRGIGTYPDESVRCGQRRGHRFIDPLAMRLCAFVGLIDDDPVLTRMALNHALAAAHCDDWCEDFLSTIPGTTFDTRGFTAYRIATNLIFAWDWAGSHLTPAGRAVLAQAVALKGLPWILMARMRYAWLRECNVGAYLGYGSILCEIALAKTWPHGGDLLDVTLKSLDETMNNYIAEDGGSFEGMGYVSSTLAHALVAYAALARHRKIELRQIVPARLLKVPDYLTAMLSTAPPLGSAINVTDGGRPGGTLYPECLGLLCSLSDDPALQGLLAGILSGKPSAKENFVTPGSVFNILFGPEKLPAPGAQPPVFRILPQSGLLCSCRPTPHGPVRLQLIGAPVKEGHEPGDKGHQHEDKGSFVLEAFGEEIAIDRGQMAYDDPRHLFIRAARYHNVLIPEATGELLPQQINHCPGAILPRGEGDEQTLHVSIDGTIAWGDLVKKWVRGIQSETPTEFLVVDEMELLEARTVSFHLHSRFPWRKIPGGWITTGKRAELTVTPEWQPVEESGEEDFIDGNKQPAHHLTLRANKAVQHRLQTRLRVAVAKPSTS